MRIMFIVSTAVLIGIAALSVLAEAKGHRPAARSIRGQGGELLLNLGDNVEIELARIPSGEFIMGSPQNETGRESDEKQHIVKIVKPYYMSKTHITVEQFGEFVQRTGYRTDAERVHKWVRLEVGEGGLYPPNNTRVESWRDDAHRQVNAPVVCVSWQDAKAFCKWLSDKTEREVTLPSEEQWEYACRAGTTTAYPWGEHPDGGKGWANCADKSFKRAAAKPLPDSAYFNWDDGFVHASPVGSFKANGFGLYDMIGNVFQWCDGGVGRIRGLRGGSWASEPSLCRCAARGKNFSNYSDKCIGFRVIVSIKEGEDGSGTSSD